jgi:ABC-2 type transport system permease protein
MTDLLAAEWVKLRSVQSTFYVLFAVALFVAMSGLIAWQTASAWDTADPARRTELAAMTPESGLLMFVQLCVAALGVLVITSEYATGTIRTTLTAVPQRGWMLAAKSVLVGALALLVGQVSVFAMFFLSRLVVGDRQIPSYLLSVTEELPRLLSLGLSVMVVGLVGLGLGTITRSTVGALTAVVALLFVFPTMGRLLPEPWNERFVAVTLNQLPSQLAGGPPRSSGAATTPETRRYHMNPKLKIALILLAILIALGAAFAVLGPAPQ